MDSRIKKQISDLVSPGWFKYYESITSTNDLAREWVRDKAPNFSLIVANEQTQGRGRGDRQWFTLLDSALAFSLILTKKLDIDYLPYYTGLGAVAICLTIEDVAGTEPKIKWPNDVLLEGRKTAGILVESSWVGDKLEAIILGIGINVTSESIPPDNEMMFPASCVENVTVGHVNRFSLLLKVLTNIQELCESFSFSDLVLEWDKRLAFKGEKVYLQSLDGGKISGVLIGISEQGKLMLELADGTIKHFAANEIHLRPV